MNALRKWFSSEIGRGITAGAVLGIGVLIAIRLGVFDFAIKQTPHGLTGAAAIEAVREDKRLADLGSEAASAEVRQIANWIADSRDANGRFVVIDKKEAKVYVFDGDARLQAASPILLGGAIGDDTVPGIGDKPIEEVLPSERTTPAGRFVGERGRNARGEDVVWVDYDSGVSMHRVLATNAAERRLERLATPTHEDNRISWGCINVPVAFYEAHLRPMFAGARAIVYVLPDTKPLDEVFSGLSATRSSQASAPLVLHRGSAAAIQ